MRNNLPINIEEEVKNILIETLDLNDSDIDICLEIDSIEKWDSLAHLMIIEKISEKFDVTIPTSHAVEMLSEKQIVNFLKKIIEN